MGQAASSHGRKLVEAVRHDDCEAVRQIVLQSPRALLHTSFWRKQTALMIASDKGNVLMVSTLLYAAEAGLGEGYGSYVNEADANGMTACMLASKRGHSTVLRVLLEQGANPLHANRRGNTSLHLAAHRGHAMCVQLLLDVPVNNPGGGMRPAAFALVTDFTGTRANHRYIDAFNRYGFAPLHLAAITHSNLAAETLILGGATLDIPIMRGPERMPVVCGGSTPLHIAASLGNAGLCASLLAAQARQPGLELRRMRNLMGMTPINCAAAGGFYEVISVFVEPRRAISSSAAAAVRMHALQGTFSESMQRNMLAMLRRAALLVQLRQIAGDWKREGRGKPSDNAVTSDIAGLEGLSLHHILQLQRLLARRGSSLRDVLFSLESVMHASSDGDSGSEGGQDSGEESEGEQEGQRLDASSRAAEIQAMGPYAAGEVAPALAGSTATARQARRRRRRAAQRQRHGQGGEGQASGTGSEGMGRLDQLAANSQRRRERRLLQRVLSEMVMLAEAQQGAGQVPGGSDTLPPKRGSSRGGSGHAACAAPTCLEECSICMDSTAEVYLRPCAHVLCFACACRLCMRADAAASCPFCRGDIARIAAIPIARTEGRAAASLEAAATL